MLVLTRRQGQGILIGPDIEVVVLDTDGGHVRVGIRAPRSVSVLRRELVEQVETENREAVAADPAGALALLGSGAPAMLGARGRRSN
jgi:carbon storage regulator